jgi:uncharacterized protein (TIGR00730 family)
MPIRSVCVLCGANPGERTDYMVAARGFGALLAERGIELVYGGTSVGLMGAVADGALERGGRVYGVLPSFLTAKEIAHRGLTELLLVESMHERKAAMADRAGAFVSLPGGYGTLDEMFEMLTFGQLGMIDKPCGVLNIGGFFDHLLGHLDFAAAEGFVKPAHRDLLLSDASPEALLDKLAEARRTRIVTIPGGTARA